MRWRWVNRFIGWSLSSPGTVGGAVPIYTSGSRATGWPLYVTSNNKLRRHTRKMISVDSCQFTSGPYNLSLFRTLGRMRTPPAALPAEESELRFNLNFRESTESFFLPIPSSHVRDNPHYESLLVVKLPESRRPDAVCKIHNIRIPRQFGCGAMNE